MTIVGLVQRILFYGLLFGGIYLLVDWLDVSVVAEPFWPILVTIATVCGAGLATNYTTLKNYTELEKGLDVGYWGRQRLQKKTMKKRRAAKARALAGFFACLITGCIGAYIRQSSEVFSTELLSVTLVVSGLSVLFAVLSVLEAVAVNQSESDMIFEQQKARDRQKIKDTLSGGDE